MPVAKFDLDQCFLVPGFPLTARSLGPHAETLDRHTQAADELLIVRSGAGVLWMEGVLQPVEQGTALVILPGEEHGFQSVQDLQLRSILYDHRQVVKPRAETLRLPGFHALFPEEQHAKPTDKPRERVTLTGAQLRYLMDLFDHLESEEEVHMPGYETIMELMFMQIIVYLARIYSRQGDPPAKRRGNRLTGVIDHMEAHYAEPILLDDLCALAHMSKNNLLRVFKQQYSVSPIEYLIRLRMLRACELMRDPELSISDIAYDVGFSDSNYFSRRFRETYGVPPTVYRKRMRPGE